MLNVGLLGSISLCVCLCVSEPTACSLMNGRWKLEHHRLWRNPHHYLIPQSRHSGDVSVTHSCDQ
uniref:Secreted protein n=1 Tax=Gadus morhua TaxID=8049 RepID=A0A8C5BRI9_GADMO